MSADECLYAHIYAPLCDAITIRFVSEKDQVNPNHLEMSKMNLLIHLFPNPFHTGMQSQDAFVKFVGDIADLLPATEAGSRFARLFDIAKKSKLHDYLVLAGPLGAYLLYLAKDIGAHERTAMTLLLQACGDLWEKVIYM